MALVYSLMDDAHADQLRRLIFKYLKYTWDHDGDMAPTLDNAAVLSTFGVAQAQAGDPCLMVLDDDKVVAFMLTGGIEFPGLEMRHKSIRTWGTYILPEYRGQGIAYNLISLMYYLARKAGYTRYIGIGIDKGEYTSHVEHVALKRGCEKVGSVYVRDLTTEGTVEAAMDKYVNLNPAETPSTDNGTRWVSEATAHE